jgi:hypothetical protein
MNVLSSLEHPNQNHLKVELDDKEIAECSAIRARS